MKLKRVVTLFTAVAAVGSALAGTASARSLLTPPAAGWYADEEGEERLNTQQANSDCQNGSDDTCGYLFDGISTEGVKHFYPL